MAREPDMDEALDALFAEAKADAPDDALMARVLADASAVQAEMQMPAETPVAPRSWLAGLVDNMGGWGMVSGVTAAGVMGLAVGLYSPDTVSGWIGAETLGLETTSYDFAPDMSDFWLEADDV